MTTHVAQKASNVQESTDAQEKKESVPGDKRKEFRADRGLASSTERETITHDKTLKSSGDLKDANCEEDPDGKAFGL